MSMSDKYKHKVKCSQCGDQCHEICYIGERVVCVKCFGKACGNAARRAARIKVWRRKEV